VKATFEKRRHGVKSEMLSRLIFWKRGRNQRGRSDRIRQGGRGFNGEKRREGGEMIRMGWNVLVE